MHTVGTVGYGPDTSAGAVALDWIHCQKFVTNTKFTSTCSFKKAITYNSLSVHVCCCCCCQESNLDLLPSTYLILQVQVLITSSRLEHHGLYGSKLL